jgi:deazaflavin-dependent oxidoreductase (nitroreductase family)
VAAWSEFDDEQYCYLTTRGRRTGQPRCIEIWFAIDEATLYMLSGGGERSSWVKNLHAEPAVNVELGDTRFAGRARVVSDRAEDEHARALVHGKYAHTYTGDLSGWRRTSLPVAVDLEHDSS